MRLDLSRRGKARSGPIALAENKNDSKISFIKLYLLLPTSFGGGTCESLVSKTLFPVHLFLRYDYKTDLSIP
jgi:hypothetical protein